MRSWYQVMDWAKRQALAHHAAEEKGFNHLSTSLASFCSCLSVSLSMSFCLWQVSPTPASATPWPASSSSQSCTRSATVLSNPLYTILISLKPPYISKIKNVSRSLCFSVWLFPTLTLHTPLPPMQTMIFYICSPVIKIQALGMEGGKGKGFAIGFFFMTLVAAVHHFITLQYWFTNSWKSFIFKTLN